MTLKFIKICHILTFNPNFASDNKCYIIMNRTVKIFSFQQFVCILILFISILPIEKAKAQENPLTLPESLKTGFEKGDANSIAGFFRETLSLELQNQNGVFSKTQAEKLLQEFFLKNKVDSFTVLQSGNTGSAENIFAIGELVSGQVHYRVYLVRSKLNNQYLIHSLSITKI